MSTDKQISERRRDMVENYYHHTDSITQITRYIGYGLLAAFYAIHSQNDLEELDQTVLFEPLALSFVLILVGIFGVLAILFDYLQHAFSAKTFKAAWKNKSGQYRYNRRSLSARASRLCFGVKQFASIAGSICLVILMIFS